jgi:hypothetical protein
MKLLCIFPKTASYAWFMQTFSWIVGDELISDAFYLSDSSQQQQVAPKSAIWSSITKQLLKLSTKSQRYSIN